MKNFQDWLNEAHEKPFLTDTENRNFIQDIQIDAWRQGMKDAGEIATSIAIDDNQIHRSPSLAKIQFDAIKLARDTYDHIRNKS